MLKNYIVIDWRNIIKSRFYAALNIIGLSTGIAFTLLVGAYVWGELQVNESLKNADRQYVIQSKWKDPNQGYEISTLGQLAKALKENYPTLVANYYSFDGITSNVSAADKSFREDIAIGDSTLLNMYGFEVLQGDAHYAFNGPFTLVITAAKAIKYFGSTDVVGKLLTIENFAGKKHAFTITAVLQNPPRNSVTGLVPNYPSSFFISDANLAYFGRNMDWNNPHIGGYIQLQKNVTPAQLTQPIARLVKLNASPAITDNMTPYLVGLKQYYLEANNGLVKKMVYALSAIALFILLMAIINFINMSVSRSATRLREIGIRKVMGGLRKQLIWQFLIESIILVFIATAIAFLLYVAAQRLLSQVLGQQIPSLNQFPIYFITIPILLIVLIGVIAGIYPAFVLSSFKPVESLKGRLSSISDKVLLRKSLVGFQFATASIAFIGAIIISKQVNLFVSKDLGYNKDYILSAQVPRDWTREGVDKMEIIRGQLATVPGVKSAALSFEIPDGNNGGQAPVYDWGHDSSQAVSMQVLESDENYLNVYQIPLQAGSFFDGHGADSAKVILNDTAIKTLGYANANDAIGRQIRLPGDENTYTIKGVTKNFHFGSMQQQIPPVIFFNVQFAPQFRFLSFKMQPGNIPATVDALRKQWAALMPGAPFEYKFMDDTLAKLYASERQLQKAAYTATVLALVIVLLGVIGLISLSIQKRTREMGIRKVLGASAANIITLFMKEFLLVILIAGVIACPVAYLVMYKWLQQYAYRIPITVTPFALSVCVLGLVTTVLICVQTIKTAGANPVKSLRVQ